MNLLKMTCSNCGAKLEVDLDNLQAYCPYCGQKLMIDFEQLGRVLAEKEKTKRTITEETEKTKRTQIGYDYESKKEAMELEDSEKTAKWSIITLIVVFVGSIMLATVVLLLGK